MTRDEAERICREIAHTNAIALSPAQAQRYLVDFVRSMVTRDLTEPLALESVDAPAPKNARRSTKG